MVPPTAPQQFIIKKERGGTTTEYHWKKFIGTTEPDATLVCNSDIWVRGDGPAKYWNGEGWVCELSGKPKNRGGNHHFINEDGSTFKEIWLSEGVWNDRSLVSRIGETV